MLDIFDNIFGRSKTSKTSLQTTSSPQPSQEQENSDGFVLLGNSNEKTITDDPPPMYPVILTDEVVD